MSEYSEETTKDPKDYKECRIHWTRAHTWLLGGGSSSHSNGTRCTVVVTRLELPNPLAAWT